MKIWKFLALGLALVSANAMAVHHTLTIGSWTTLPECGGEVMVTRSGNGSGEQVNLVFRGVRECSNFDIKSIAGGFLDVNYKNRKLQERADGTRGGSFTIPKRFLERGLNDVQIEVRSNSGKHSENIDIAFVASAPARHVEVDPVPVAPAPGDVHGSY